MKRSRWSRSSRGIGRAEAKRLAQDGYAVCANYIQRGDKAGEWRICCAPRAGRPWYSGWTWSATEAKVTAMWRSKKI